MVFRFEATVEGFARLHAFTVTRYLQTHCKIQLFFLLVVKFVIVLLMVLDGDKTNLQTPNWKPTQKNMSLTITNGILKFRSNAKALKRVILVIFAPSANQMGSKLLHSWSSSTQGFLGLMVSSSIGAMGIAVGAWASKLNWVELNNLMRDSLGNETWCGFDYKLKACTHALFRVL